MDPWLGNAVLATQKANQKKRRPQRSIRTKEVAQRPIRTKATRRPISTKTTNQNKGGHTDDHKKANEKYWK